MNVGILWSLVLLLLSYLSGAYSQSLTLTADALAFQVSVFFNSSSPYSQISNLALNIAFPEISNSTLLSSLTPTYIDGANLTVSDIVTFLSTTNANYIILSDSDKQTLDFCQAQVQLSQSQGSLAKLIPILSLASTYMLSYPNSNGNGIKWSNCPNIILMSLDSHESINSAIDLLYRYSNPRQPLSVNLLTVTPSVVPISSSSVEDSFYGWQAVNAFSARSKFRGFVNNHIFNCNSPSDLSNGLSRIANTFAGSNQTNYVVVHLPANYGGQPFLAAAKAAGLLSQFTTSNTVQFVFGSDMMDSFEGILTPEIDGLIGFVRDSHDKHHKDVLLYTNFISTVKNSPNPYINTINTNATSVLRLAYSAYDIAHTISQAALALPNLAVIQEQVNLTKGGPFLLPPSVTSFPLYNSTVYVTFLGATGTISFRRYGTNIQNLIVGARRRLYRLSLVQLVSLNSGGGKQTKAGYWSPFEGFLIDEWNTFKQVNGAALINFLIPTVADNIAIPAPFVSDNWIWTSIPWSGTAPTPRIGHCTAVSEASNLLYVFAGTFSPSQLPRTDLYIYNFVTTQWTLMPSPPPTSALSPRFYFYGGCGVGFTSEATQLQTERLYTFGGISGDGVVGQLWKFTLSTQSWSRLTLPDSITSIGTMDRAEFGYISTMNQLVIYSGVHPVSLTEQVFIFHMDTETWEINYPSYTVVSWLQNKTYVPPASVPVASLNPGYSLIEQTLQNFHPILARAVVNGDDTLFIIGGRFAIANVVLVYSFSKNIIGPFLTWGAAIPYDLQLTVNGVAFNNKIFITHGWSESAVINFNTLYTLDINCPGPTCGMYSELAPWNTDTRDSFTPVQLGTDLLIFGGWGAKTINNDFLSLNLVSGDKKKILENTISPPPRAFAASCNLGNIMYLFGGINSQSVALGDFWGFNHDTALWSSIRSTNQPPAPRYGHSLTNLRAAVYLYGGTNGQTAFGDLNVFSSFTNTWTTLAPTSSSLSNLYPSFSPRAYFVSASLSESISVVFGGVDTTNTILNDLWYYNRINAVWILYSDVSPIQTYLAAGVAVGGSLYVFGGLDAGQNSNYNAYVADLNPLIALTYSAGVATTPLTNIWKSLSSMPGKGRSGLTAAAIDGSDMIAIYGGSYYEIQVADLLLYSISSDTYAVISQASLSGISPLSVKFPPAPPAGLTSVVYGNRFIWFGGSTSASSASQLTGSSTSVNIRAADYLTNQMWAFNFGQPCLNSKFNTNVSAISQQCTVCGAGTIMQANSCISCPPGTYANAPSGATSCVPCTPGYYSSIAGAISQAYCVPCQFGSYSNTSGAVSCSPCPTNFVCPVGSPFPISASASYATGIVYNQSQPQPLTPRTTEVIAVVQIVSIVLGVVFVALFALYIVANHVLFVGDQLKKADVLFDLSHFNNIDGPLFRRQTPMGGFFTIFCAVLVAYFIFTLSYPFKIDNLVEVRSLIPTTAVQDYDLINADVLFTVTVGNEYRGSCISPGSSPVNVNSYATPGSYSSTVVNATGKAVFDPLLSNNLFRNNIPKYPCSSGITVTWDSINLQAAAYLCSPSITTDSTGFVTAKSCTVYLGVIASKPTAVASNFRFLFYETDTFANTLQWSMSSTSGYVGQNSALSGSLTPLSPYNLFRGGDKPNVVQVDLTPARNTDTGTNTTTRGNHLFFAGAVRGTETAPTLFNLNDGLEVWFSQNLLITTLDVVVSPKLTIQQFVASLLGSISGAIGGVAVLMAVFEIIEEMIMSKLKSTRLGTIGTYALLVKRLVNKDQDAMGKQQSFANMFAIGEEKFIDPLEEPTKPKLNTKPHPPHLQPKPNSNTSDHPSQSGEVQLHVINTGNFAGSNGEGAAAGPSAPPANPAMNRHDTNANFRDNPVSDVHID